MSSLIGVALYALVTMPARRAKKLEEYQAEYRNAQKRYEYESETVTQVTNMRYHDAYVTRHTRLWEDHIEGCNHHAHEYRADFFKVHGVEIFSAAGHDEVTPDTAPPSPHTPG